MLSQQSQEGLRHLAPGSADANRGNSRSGWFRIGLMAAAVSAPVIARWNDLRGRARREAIDTLRAEAGSRLNDLGANLEAGLENARTLIASGEPRAREALESVAATASAVQDFAQSAAQKVSAGLGDFNENIVDFVETQRSRLNRQPTGQRRQQINTALWLTGIGVGVAVAGVGAYLIIRRRLEHMAEEEALLEAPLNSNGAYPSTRDAANASPIARSSAVVAPLTASTEQAMPAAAFTSPSGAMSHADEMGDEASVDEESLEEEERPAYIGNIHTLIYHDANAANLPAQENQVYFSDEEQARAAGFHRARGEAALATTPERLSEHMAIVSTEPPHEPVSPDIAQAAEMATTYEPGERANLLNTQVADDELDKDGDVDEEETLAHRADAVTLDDELSWRGED